MQSERREARGLRGARKKHTEQNGKAGASRVPLELKTNYLQVSVNNASIVAVLDSLQQRADEIPGLLLVVHHLFHDAVEQLPPCITSWTSVEKMETMFGAAHI